MRPGGRRRRSVAPFGIDEAGRWGVVHPRQLPDPGALEGDGDMETLARILLRRWGVLFRKLLEREPSAPPWRELLRVLRRLEARGEIRGGRFVDGFAGEQYALSDCVSQLRRVRRAPREGKLVAVSAADPLNLVGVLTPGARVPVHADNRILYRDGVPVAVRVAGEVRLLDPQAERAPDQAWELRQALQRRSLSPSLRRLSRFA